MEQEVETWIKQAERDIVSAKNSAKSEDYYVATFMSQQAVEKSLKAGVIEIKDRLIKTHSVTRLAKELAAPVSFLNKISIFEPVYQQTRYPDITASLPAEDFKEEDAKLFIKTAEEVVAWIRKKIGQ